CPTILAARTYIPSLIIFKRKCTIPGLLNSALVSSVMEFTNTAYMKKCLFQKYIEHFIHSILPTYSVLLILDSYKSHINYAYINFYFNNNIFLYALLSHTTHILQPAKLSFAQLKKAYNKGCEQLCLDNNSELVTKYTFTKILGLAYIKIYTSMSIYNIFKTTKIWLFNLNAISLDCLNPSLTTEQFNISPIQPTPASSSSQFSSTQSLSIPTSLLQSSNLNPSSNFIINKKKTLKIEVKLFNIRVNQLEAKLKAMKDELETLKNSGICSLYLALKYPFSYTF
ncbi:24602_t:CDS:1, partial [Cetraspora pellucida]